MQASEARFNKNEKFFSQQQEFGTMMQRKQPIVTEEKEFLIIVKIQC